MWIEIVRIDWSKVISNNTMGIFIYLLRRKYSIYFSFIFHSFFKSTNNYLRVALSTFSLSVKLYKIRIKILDEYPFLKMVDEQLLIASILIWIL
jgi:hypothetical protein